MAYMLREMSIPEILDQSFGVLKEHFVPIAGAVAIVQVPFSWASTSLSLAFQGAELPALDQIGVYLLVILAGLALMPLTQLAATRATAAGFVGEPLSLGAIFRDGARAYLPYVGTTILVALAMLPLFLLLIVPALYFGLCWTLIGPLAIVERTYGPRAMKRSRTLVRPHFWHTVGVVLALFLLMWIVSLAASWALGSIPVAGPLLMALVTSVANAFSLVGIVVLYFDLRCRQEDFDAARLTAELGTDAPPGARGAGAHAPVRG